MSLKQKGTFYSGTVCRKMASLYVDRQFGGTEKAVIFPLVDLLLQGGR